MSYVRRFNMVTAEDKGGDESKKTRWLKLGVAFEREDGRIDCRLQLQPTGPWDGRFYLFEAKPHEEGAPQNPDWVPSAETPFRSAPNRQPGEPMQDGWKKPDDYVAKVHMKGEAKNRTLCKRFAKAENMTESWGAVTCKSCQAERSGAPTDQAGVDDSDIPF